MKASLRSKQWCRHGIAGGKGGGGVVGTDLLGGIVQGAAEWTENRCCEYNNVIVSINKIESIDIK
jgi:hypothetical protein